MKKKNDAFSRLLDWLENGDQALDTEMEDTLSEPYLPEKNEPKKKKKKAEKGKTVLKAAS